MRLAVVLLVVALCFTPARAEEPERFQVRVVRDVAYVNGEGADPEKHKLNLFLPEGKKDFPVVLFVHGGGWSSGDRKIYFGIGNNLARNGVGAIVISYRLSPQVHHPAHIQDVARAFGWAHSHIAEYGGDPDRMFVTGQSAGGHLAALLATNDRYLKDVGLSIKDVKGCVPISGIYVFRSGRFQRVLGDDPKAADDASPVKHVTGKEPPFLILYADGDFPTCDAMSRALGDALSANKVEAAVKEIPDRSHITIIARPMFNDADPVMQALLGFVRDHSSKDR